jgi:hypothetical protein
METCASVTHARSLSARASRVALACVACVLACLAAPAVASAGWASDGAFLASRPDAADVQNVGGQPWVAYDTSQAVYVSKLVAGSWSAVGAALTTTGYDDLVSMTVIGGTPYVAYVDSTGGGSPTYKIHVKWWNGSSWVDLGGVAAYSSTVTSYYGVDISNDGTNPVITFTTGWWDGPVHAARWTGAAWSEWGTQVNTGISPDGNSRLPHIGMLSGTPFVAYEYFAVCGPPCIGRVRTWNGSTWNQVQTANGEGRFVTIGTNLYWATDDYRVVKVSRFDGVSWTSLGGPIGTGNLEDLASDGTQPVVSLLESGGSGTRALRWNGSAWVEYAGSHLSGPATTPSGMTMVGAVPYVVHREPAAGVLYHWVSGSSTSRIVPNADRAGMVAWNTDGYDSAIPGCFAGQAFDGTWWAKLSEDIGSPVDGSCYQPTGADWVSSATNATAGTNSVEFELTDPPMAANVVTSITAWVRAWKTSSKTATVAVTLHKSDGTVIATWSPVLTTSAANYSATFGSLSLTRAEAAGMYVTFAANITGGGGATAAVVSVFNADLTYTELANTPPNAPVLIGPAEGSTQTSLPTLQFTFSDPDAADTGQGEIYICDAFMQCNTIPLTTSVANGATQSHVLTLGEFNGNNGWTTWYATNIDSKGARSILQGPNHFTMNLPVPPSNSSPPTISGTTTMGQVLTATTGTWNNSPTGYTYQWRRCNPTCIDIAGATASTYTLVAADVDDTIVVVVTASNGGGSSSATSSNTGTIAGTLPSNSVLPTITGLAQQGALLTASTGTWGGYGPASYTYQWRRCNAAGASCVDIVGATSSTYTTVTADVASTLRVVVTATNSCTIGCGSATATSNATGQVTPTAQFGGVDGSASSKVAGTTLVVPITSAASANDFVVLPITFDTATTVASVVDSKGNLWYFDKRVSNGVVDSTETWSSFITAPLTTSDTVTITLAASTTVRAAALYEFSGVVNHVLDSSGSATGSSTTPSAALTTTYAFVLAFGAAGTNGVSGDTFAAGGGFTAATPAGTTGTSPNAAVFPSWRLTNATGTYTASGTLGTSRTWAETITAYRITDGSGLPPSNTVLPTITGTTTMGQVLTANDGTWSGSTSTARFWSRCSSAGTSCQPISGATGTTYTLTSADVDSTIRVTVIATNVSGSTSATSAATAVIAGTLPANSVAPSISGTAQNGLVLTGAAGTWTGYTPQVTTWQWQRCTPGCTNIVGATASTYTLVNADVGATIRLVVTQTNTCTTGCGATSANSALTATVTQMPAPVNTALPTISGTTSVGQVLTATTGTWTSNVTPTYAYQWQRCTPICSNIVGATSSTYTLVVADAGATIKVIVTATNAGGSTPATSAATATVIGVTVTSASPSTIVQGRQGLVVQVSGTGFQSGASSTISGTGITVVGTTWVSSTRVDVTYNATSAATLGARNITVTNPDTSNATGTGVISVIAPTITVSLSTLGYADAARTPSPGPYTIDFGTLLAGATAQVGPATSGQRLAGPAVALTMSSDTDYVVQAASTNFTAGAKTMPAGSLSWKHDAVVQAWTPFTTGGAGLESATAPGSTTYNYDLQVSVPASQAPATYTGTVTYSVIPAF